MSGPVFAFLVFYLLEFILPLNYKWHSESLPYLGINLSIIVAVPETYCFRLQNRLQDKTLQPYRGYKNDLEKGNN